MEWNNTFDSNYTIVILTDINPLFSFILFEILPCCQTGFFWQQISGCSRFYRPGKNLENRLPAHLRLFAIRVRPLSNFSRNSDELDDKLAKFYSRLNKIY